MSKNDAKKFDSAEIRSAKYEQLKVAVQDLLCELRIDEKCLGVMANGYSPDYPGAVDLAFGDVWKNPRCKVQLSAIVAQKLIDAGVRE